MPRPIWNGSISFGLVTIPIKLYNAISRKSVSFNQLDTRTGARIKYQKVSAADGEEVPNEAIGRAFEYSKGKYVMIGDDELAAVAPKASRTVDIQAFVPLDEIEPMLFDGAYYAAPADGFEKPYKLLTEALERDGRVAIARFVRANKEYLAALRPVDGRLAVSTLVYADEVVEPEEIPEFDGLEDVKLSDGELAMAGQLIESLVADFDHAQFHDDHREQLREMLRAKASGEEVVVPSEPAAEATNVVDLMAALEASVAAAKAARSGGGSSDAAVADAGDEEDEAPAPATRARSTTAARPAAKKAAAKRAAPKKAATAKTAKPAKKAATAKRKSA